MAFKRFGFTKLWTDPAAFPTVETDEVQVRADMQVLHDESKNGLNGLMAEMEAKTASASLGAKAPDGSTASNVQKELDDLNAAKHTHSNKALLDTYTQTEANLKSAVTNKHTHSNKTILDAVTASFTTALATAYNRLVTLFSGITSVATTLGTDNTSIPTSKAVSDALTASGSLPTGGSTNQVLSKTSAGNYATAWKTITPAGIGAATAEALAEQAIKFEFFRSVTPKFELISYVGDASTHSASYYNPKSVTFSITPRLVIVLSKTCDTSETYDKVYYPYNYIEAQAGQNITPATIYMYHYNWMVDTSLLPVGEFAAGVGLGRNDDKSSAYGKKSEDGKTIYWHCYNADNSGELTFNMQGRTYTLLGIEF